MKLLSSLRQIWLASPRAAGAKPAMACFYSAALAWIPLMVSFAFPPDCSVCLDHGIVEGPAGNRSHAVEAGEDVGKACGVR
jgi:hypothetical protein